MTGPAIPVGAPVVGSHGEPLGTVGAVYLHDETGRPAFAAVQGRAHPVLVPLRVSRFDGAALHVPYGVERLDSAPPHDPAAHISFAQGDELARHYGLLPAAVESTDRPGDPAVVRSEERLSAGTVDVVVGRARLETYVVTEEHTFTVPVRRQEVRLVHEPVPADQQVVSDVGPREHVHEVVLFAEQVQITTRLVPVERVRLVRRVVTGEQRLTATVRSEQIDVEVDPRPDGTPGA